MPVSRLRLVSIDNPNEVIEPATQLDDDYIAALHHPLLRSHIVIRPDGMIEARRVYGVYRSEFDLGSLLEAQRKRAARRRTRVGDQAVPLRQIIERLVFKPELRELSAREIWPHFFSELRDQGCDPSESVDRSSLSYEFGTGRRKMTFKTFRNAIAEIRRHKAQ
ncbi:MULTISPECIES: hypothetical protein [unclassified Bradyrhizobium]|uniref:hypothetical protein n=1 Tax=unclassified Bradyrhizobium TaxID=2631580 RepID=UPI0016059CFD|nr:MULTISPECIES: hypothetical protein [unclassified Bradyrhizobium]MBB4258790.1 hypothetical protein [Bradyrhizobium sp. CIR3A]MBB4361520.1 hypothetical protein [Bradyrhizobium sp. CIR18]